MSPSTPSGPRPTIKDVAAGAGVSTAAVSKVFNNTGRISEPTRRRILDAAERLGWSPSASASALRRSRTRTVAMVVRRPTDVLGADPFFSELITGLESELSPRGYGLLLHLAGDVREETALYERLAAEGRVDGAVLTEHRADDPRLPLLKGLGLPAVLLSTAHGNGITEAVGHLLALGHRRIGYVCGPDDLLHTRFRLRVLREALAAHGLVPAAVVHTDFTEAEATAATERLLALDDRPTALVYANDSMAVCGLGTAQRAGLSVPGELSVVGYDNLPLGRWIHPRLTTVDQYVQQAGAAAARELLAQCGEDVRTEPLTGQPRLVIRESTGPA
ncbi:LacI family DNA-binding transcriptional regulator [Streptomyces sp. NBC_01766]|uniref:LacI family DNA-binding transcriptional regulator n=1 Tax=Streptomyces sp. NBC_01766 TaxID=2975936 RepID=UPI002DD9F68C|nr:LacI family DNA-binding transcriptional regulator [Streptomyces sp. NBC_01766]WSC23125.1 LacI family transcriptional regulator [Streptomyces sp. NBC_01766]